MSIKSRVPVQEYGKIHVEGSRELQPEIQGGTALADVQAIVCYNTIKPWTLDHLHLTFDTIALGDGGDATIEVLKVPASVKIDTYLVSGSSSVVPLTDEFIIDELTPLAVNDLMALSEAASGFEETTEEQRRFVAGDRLVVLLRNFSRTGALGAGSGSSASGADLDIGFENATLSWLGRSVRL